MSDKRVKKDSSLQYGSSSSVIKRVKLKNKDSKFSYSRGERITKDESIQPKNIMKMTPSNSLKKPGTIGNFEKIRNWKVIVLESCSKKKANKLIESGNDFFRAASSGKYFLAVKVRCDRIGGKDEFLDVRNHNFGLVGDKKRLQDSIYLGLEPQVHSTMLIGGYIEGWVTFEVSEDDDNFVLIFEDSSFWNNRDRIYISLK